MENHLVLLYTLQSWVLSFVATVQTVISVGWTTHYKSKKQPLTGGGLVIAGIGIVKKIPTALQYVDEIIKKTYRTLMTRGMKGCYVYFYNQALAHHFMHQLQPQQEEKKEFVLNPKSMTM